MSMSMNGCEPDDPTADLPLSDPRCRTDCCNAFSEGHKASQAAVSYYDQFHYGHFTVWYCLATIGLGICLNLYSTYRKRHPRLSEAESGAATGLWNKTTATIRMISYRHLDSRYLLPSLGTTIYILVTTLFLLLLTFIERPYYREFRGYGSPPIGVRTGMIATALIPFIIALGGKVNFVTLLTGTSHEKLNVLHRWAGYLCLFFSVVHTVPFLVQPYKEGGAAGLRARFYRPGGLEFTGVPPLGMLVGLCVLSVPFIRNRYYNFFYRFHIPLWIVFLATMFWHAKDLQDSWAYLWATLALYLASLLGRVFWKNRTTNIHHSPWLAGFDGVVKSYPDGLIKLTVEVPGTVKWLPGQHVWLRIPSLSISQGHPFTIYTLPSTSNNDTQRMSFMIRRQRRFTKSLLELAEQRCQQATPARPISVHVDGPYGGSRDSAMWPLQFDHLLFVAGGSGIAGCLPHLLHVANMMRDGTAAAVRCRLVRLVWAVRSASHQKWAEDELALVANGLQSLDFSIDVYITRNVSEEGVDSLSSAGVESDDASGRYKEAAENQPSANSTAHKSAVRGLESKAAPAPVFTTQSSRPDLPLLIPLLLQGGGRRALVFGCGSESFRSDLANGTARAQRQVLTGAMDSITLHTEAFGL